MVPLEMVLLLKLQPKAAETSAVVALLDCYGLDDVLILVLERLDPYMDMIDYLNSKLSSLSENVFLCVPQGHQAGKHTH